MTKEEIIQREAVDMLTLVFCIPFCWWFGWWGLVPPFVIGFGVNCWADRKNKETSSGLPVKRR